jgi:hypothetical protein
VFRALLFSTSQARCVRSRSHACSIGCLPAVYCSLPFGVHKREESYKGGGLRGTPSASNEALSCDRLPQFPSIYKQWAGLSTAMMEHAAGNATRCALLWQHLPPGSGPWQILPSRACTRPSVRQMTHVPGSPGLSAALRCFPHRQEGWPFWTQKDTRETHQISLFLTMSYGMARCYIEVRAGRQKKLPLALSNQGMGSGWVPGPAIFSLLRTWQTTWRGDRTNSAYLSHTHRSVI